MPAAEVDNNISPETDTKIEEEEKEEEVEGDTSSVEVETGSKSNVPYYGEADIFSLVAKQQQMLAQRRLSQQKIQQQQMIVLASLYGQAGNREGGIERQADAAPRRDPRRDSDQHGRRRVAQQGSRKELKTIGA